ncbi:MAG: response regulator [Bdellovibrionales bacterium]
MNFTWTNINILVVEDDPFMREMLSMILEDEGATVHCAENGEKAKEVLQEMPVDIVVSDVQMPVCDGVDLLKWVKEHYSDKPLVFLATGFADITEEDAISLGAEAVIKKPFEADTMVQYLSDSFEKLTEIEKIGA